MNWCWINPPPPPQEERYAKQKAEKIPDLHREDPLVTQQRQETGNMTPDPFWEEGRGGSSSIVTHDYAQGQQVQDI